MEIKKARLGELFHFTYTPTHNSGSIRGMKRERVAMKERSSFRTGGMGEIVIVEDMKEIQEVVEEAAASGRRLHILGEGTNTIFGEDLVMYLFVKISILGISTEYSGDDMLLTAHAGENWDNIVEYAVENNLSGIENLSYIPGSVGAAPVQNIGAYGMELKDSLESVYVFDTETMQYITLTKNECMFGYRDSIFKKNPRRYIIISITLRMKKTFDPVLTYKPLDALVGKEGVTLSMVRDEVIRIRTEKLPNYHEHPNCGSFFKNQVISLSKGDELRMHFPDIPLHRQGDGYKVPTAWLIEHVAEMKGVERGGIGTWPKQPLVLVNYGNASLHDVELFAEEILSKVKQGTGITIEREVNFVQ
jgi:UDP-N-acetylmuramate dehydrogenase